MKKESVTIDGVQYVPADSIKISNNAKDLEGMKYIICRTYAAGVFAGYLQKQWVEGGLKLAILQKARRLWYWDGAASLSQLSVDGVSKPQNCKFPCEVEEVELSNVVEILPVTEKAKLSIDGVKVWKN
jgi:hypothetical protein